LEALKSKEPATGNPASLTLEDVTRLVRNVTTEEKEKQSKESNRNFVNTQIIAAFGNDADKAKSGINARLTELGMSMATLRSLSETNPKAALALISNKPSAEPPKPTTTRPSGDVNTEALRAGLNDGDAKSNSYYMALRKKMGTNKFYADTQLIKRMYADADKLGGRFLDS
jgi:hypothetical protein